ncbi:hypothetical protein [Roseobacter sp. S98]|uniref:hypothetical protein n=1 Tax=Roseobacter algicola (ex Choi et al. 2025) (nom. illeg.) TaxID=3092138 RepID=UPI0035C6D7D3
MTGPSKKKTVTPPRSVDLRCFAIVLMPVLIFLTHKFIGTHLMPRDLGVSDGIVKPGQDWLEAAGRYRFLAASWLFGALSVLAAAMLCMTLLRPLAPATRIAAILTFLFVVLLAALPTLRDFGDAGGSQVYDRLGKDVFENVLSRGTLKGCADAADTWLMGTCGDAPVISMFAVVVDMMNIFAGLALGSIIVGMILCLNDRDTRDIEEEAALLAENLRHMRQQLYLSGLVLSFGMLYAASWIYWPLPLIADAERSAYSAVLLSASLYTGTYFSLLMLSFYLPVAFILDTRIKRLASRADHAELTGEPPDSQSWRSERGLKEGVAEYLRAGFALTSPILAAFAGGISPLAL